MMILVILVPALVVGVLRLISYNRSGPAEPVGPGVLARAAPMLLGMAAVGVFFFVMLGAESTSRIPVLGLVLALAFAAAISFRARHRSTVAERSWSAPASASRPAERPTPASSWSVSRALGRVESRQLFQSPWFGVGLGFCVLLTVMFGVLFASDNGSTWDGYVQLAPWLAHPLVGMSVLAAHRAVTRARRDHADELFDTCPTDATTRTVGFLLSAVTPVLILAVYLSLLFSINVVRSPHLYGPLSADNLADVLAAVALGAGGITLGVALGRWVRFALAPAVALAVVLGVALRLNSIGDPGWNPWAALSTAPAVPDPAPIFIDRAAWWHLAWVVALTCVVGALALARHRRDGKVVGFGLAAAALAVISIVGTTGSPADPELIASRVTDPGAHQRCSAAGGSVRVCVYRQYGEVLERLIDQVGPVARALPPTVGPITLRQRFNGQLGDLQPAVRRPIGTDLPGGLKDEVTLGFDIFAMDDAGFDVAFAALGLPTEPDRRRIPTVVAGQARGVIALWLAARGMTPDEARALATSPDPGSPDAFERGTPDDDPCHTPSVVWSAQDLHAARAVIGLPAAEVAQVVISGWDRWKDPASGTDELLAALGLPGVGPFDQVEPRPAGTC